MKRWHTIVGLLISVITLYLAFRKADFGEVVGIFRSVNYGYVAFSCLFVILGNLIRGLRWHSLIRRKLSLADSFWLWNTGFLFNNILPAKLGEIVRALLAARRPEMAFSSALSSIVVERLFDMLCVVISLGIALLGLDLPGWATGAAVLMAVGAVAGIGALAAMARFPQAALRAGSRVLSIAPGITREQAVRFLQKFTDGLGGVSDLRIFAAGLGLSLLAWGFSTLATWTLMLAFWPGAPLMVGLLVSAASGLGIAVPAAPSGIGPYQASIIGALTAIGYDTGISQSFAIARHAQVFIVTSLLGAVGLLREGVGFQEIARQAQTIRQRASTPESSTTTPLP